MLREIRLKELVDPAHLAAGGGQEADLLDRRAVGAQIVDERIDRLPARFELGNVGNRLPAPAIDVRQRRLSIDRPERGDERPGAPILGPYREGDQAELPLSSGRAIPTS